MTAKRHQTRKLIMDAAYVLFRRRGYTRANVDEIADAAGITKRTLYSHFESKDALLEAVLEAQYDTTFAAFQTFGLKLVGTPQDIVTAFFNQLFRWSGKAKWPGSGFTRLAMELADLPGHPARRIASRHKKLLEEHLADALARAGAPDATASARQIMIISEGTIALILIHGDRSYCVAAERAAQAVLHCSPSDRFAG